MFVADASAVVDALLWPATNRELVLRLTERDDPGVAPDLLDAEVLSVIRRLAARGEVEPMRGRGALETLAELPVTRFPSALLLGHAWELRENLTAYDALYVALAQAMSSVLLTTDQRMARAAREHGVATA